MTSPVLFQVRVSPSVRDAVRAAAAASNVPMPPYCALLIRLIEHADGALSAFALPVTDERWANRFRRSSSWSDAFAAAASVVCAGCMRVKLGYPYLKPAEGTRHACVLT